MEKNIKDYLHLYLPFELNYFGFKYNVVGFRDKGHFFTFWHEHGFFDILKEYLKLPLRPLSLNEMTEEEKKQIKLKEGFDLTRYLLSKHFDIFNLIEAGLAIDKTKNYGKT